MTRLFVPREQWQGSNVYITGDDTHYITRVLRLGPGDTLTVLDGEGRAFNAAIKSIDTKKVCLDIIGEIKPDVEPSLKVRLFQAVPKGDKMDLVVQKAAELGVAMVVPLVTERAVVRLDTGRALRRRERWQKISREAARQCGRTVVPKVLPVMTLEEALNFFAAERGQAAFPDRLLGIMPWEGEESLSLRDCLTGKRPDTVSIFIGPEGGFSLAEVRAAQQQGIATVTLGRRILRTETAGIITPALVMYTFGEIG
ncbi:MAG: 16S rRNA (uracil(1498)-N(3))-methyltransferase [Bacillota bacterium]